MQQSKKPILFLILLAIISVIAFMLFQQGYFNQAPTNFAPPYPMVNANGDPILAVYEGRVPFEVSTDSIPCTDCEKIKTGIVLYHHLQTKAPTTYWFGRVDVGQANDRLVTEGAWTIRRGIKDYPSAVVYTLDSNTPENLRSYWLVNQDILLPLDKEMNPKVGNAAWGYMLSRIH